MKTNIWGKQFLVDKKEQCSTFVYQRESRISNSERIAPNITFLKKTQMTKIDDNSSGPGSINSMKTVFEKPHPVANERKDKKRPQIKYRVLIISSAVISNLQSFVSIPKEEIRLDGFKSRLLPDELLTLWE